MRFFRVGRRRKKLVDVLPGGHYGVYRTSVTLQFDAAMRREIESGRRIVIPGKVMEDDSGATRKDE